MATSKISIQINNSFSLARREKTYPQVNPLRELEHELESEVDAENAPPLDLDANIEILFWVSALWQIGQSGSSSD
jgi:hypothetical protein